MSAKRLSVCRALKQFEYGRRSLEGYSSWIAAVFFFLKATSRLWSCSENSLLIFRCFKTIFFFTLKGDYFIFTWEFRELKPGLSSLYINMSTCILWPVSLHLLILIWTYFHLPDKVLLIWFSTFHATDLFWYSLKTSENFWFADVFRGYQKRSVAWNGLTRMIFLLEELIWVF